LVNECKAVSVLNDGDNPSDHLAVSCRVNVDTGLAQLTGNVCQYTKEYKIKLE